MVETYILHIDKDSADIHFDDLLNCISSGKREKILRMQNRADARRSLLGDVLARYALCKKLCVVNKQLAFGTNPYGKPILTSSNKVHFNISHSGEWVVCAVDNYYVGIDVETVRQIDLQIAEEILLQEEYQLLMRQEESSRLKYFYMYWTLKESYLKAIGKGFGMLQDSFIAGARRDTDLFSVDPAGKYHFSHPYINNGVVCSVCFQSQALCKFTYNSIAGFLQDTKGYF